MKEVTIVSIAQVAHETNRAYCQSIGDDSQRSWEEAPGWQRVSAINGVKFHVENPTAPAFSSHQEWLNEKFADGWKYGEVKDPDKKEHPCCVPYDELPIEQQVKDTLFIGVVRALKILLKKE